jgi:hypothetical protein
MAMKSQRMLQAVEEGDAAMMANDLHEDFMFVADYSMEDREQWIAAAIEDFKTGSFKFNQPELLLETDDIVVFQDIRVVDGKEVRHLNSTFFRDEKAWRTMINRVPL